MAARTFPSVLDLALGGSGALDGAGATGDLIGITTMLFTTVAGTSRGAEPSITGTVSTGAADAVDFVPERRTGLSMEIAAQLEDMPPPAVRVVSARGHLADTTVVDRQGPFPRAAGPASAEEPAVGEAEEAGTGN